MLQTAILEVAKTVAKTVMGRTVIGVLQVVIMKTVMEKSKLALDKTVMKVPVEEGITEDDMLDKMFVSGQIGMKMMEVRKQKGLIIRRLFGNYFKELVVCSFFEIGGE